MTYKSTQGYLKLLNDLAAKDTPQDIISSLMGYVKSIYRSELQNNYSKPMLWIGMYIALASLLCILAMVADLIHGLRNRKFWFPCKYFIVNALSLSVISVAMKLPVDLSGSMPGDVDQAAKLGSMAFICTMMANLLPSLAAMNSKELLTNITALGVLVITLAVNVCIQINTGVVSYKEDAQLAQTIAQKVDLRRLGITNKHRNVIIAAVYVTVLLVLLIIHVCLSLAILKSKKKIESKYQKGHERASKDFEQPSGELVKVEKLKQHVRNYWIMAGSGSPQFIAACSVTTTAAGVISILPTVLHTLTMSWTIKAMLDKDYDSDYGWSMLVILIVQFVGVIVGTIAPLFRCFASLSFKVSIKSIPNHMKVFKVEEYWSWMLKEWKQGSMPFRFHSNKLKAVIHYSRNIILNFCIDFQEAVVVVCKTIALVPFFLMICALSCFRGLKWLLKTMLRSSGKKNEKAEQSEDLGPYVLQLEDEMELAESTLESLSKTLDRLVRKREKKRPKNLVNLIEEKSTDDFSGVRKFDEVNYIPVFQPKEYRDCWSLPVITLTTVAVSLPDIETEQVDSLSKSVREGFVYVILVEENLNSTDDYVSIRKAAETLWPEVNFDRKWLGNELRAIINAPASDQVDKTKQIVEWFKNTARKMATPQVGSGDIDGTNDDSIRICANSMYRITKTILDSYHEIANIDDKVSQRQLFDKISSMIADIMAACFTNLPQVIAMKCHTSEIERREASVRTAAKILGKTKQIIEEVQKRQPSRMNPEDLPFINKWRDYFAKESPNP